MVLRSSGHWSRLIYSRKWLVRTQVLMMRSASRSSSSFLFFSFSSKVFFQAVNFFAAGRTSIPVVMVNVLFTVRCNSGSSSVICWLELDVVWAVRSKIVDIFFKGFSLTHLYWKQTIFLFWALAFTVYGCEMILPNGLTSFRANWVVRNVRTMFFIRAVISFRCFVLSSIAGHCLLAPTIFPKRLSSVVCSCSVIRSSTRRSIETKECWYAGCRCKGISTRCEYQYYRIWIWWYFDIDTLFYFVHLLRLKDIYSRNIGLLLEY